MLMLVFAVCVLLGVVIGVIVAAQRYAKQREAAQRRTEIDVFSSRQVMSAVHRSDDMDNAVAIAAEERHRRAKERERVKGNYANAATKDFDTTFAERRK